MRAGMGMAVVRVAALVAALVEVGARVAVGLAAAAVAAATGVRVDGGEGMVGSREGGCPQQLRMWRHHYGRH